MPDTHTHRNPAAADTGHVCPCTRQHVWVLFDFWWRHSPANPSEGKRSSVKTALNSLGLLSITAEHTAVPPLLLPVIALLTGSLCGSCCCLERKPFVVAENTEIPARNQQISNFKFQFLPNASWFHAILHLKKKNTKRTHPSVSFLSVRTLCGLESKI